MFNRVRGFALLHQGDAQVHVGFGMVLLERQRLAICGHGGIELALQLENVAVIHMRVGETWLELHRALEMPDRLVEPAQHA